MFSNNRVVALVRYSLCHISFIGDDALTHYKCVIVRTYNIGLHYDYTLLYHEFECTMCIITYKHTHLRMYSDGFMQQNVDYVCCSIRYVSNLSCKDLTLKNYGKR